MELWPGYITSIRQHETQLLVCAEVTHKVMRDETILEILLRVRRDHREFQPEFQREVLGTTVLTKYNNKTYRIDDVDFDKKPTDTFDTKDGPISFIEYYQRVSANTLSFLLQKNLFVNYFFFLQRYNLKIRDANQPLLVSKAKKRDLRGGGQDVILLVPELCYATGITDRMRNDFR